jgi:MbtH protein
LTRLLGGDTAADHPRHNYQRTTQHRGADVKTTPETTYDVVINDEEQYSIWSSDQRPPPGWRSVGVTGSKDQCLRHIEEVWTDLRPLSLRRAMNQEPGQLTR